MATTRRHMQHRQQRRAGERGFATHLVVFLFVNALLFAVSVARGNSDLAFWVFCTWGVGLAIHAYFTFLEGSLRPD